jgi:hypothetical protein
MGQQGQTDSPARPWLRPAAIAKKDEAINVAVTELVKEY